MNQREFAKAAGVGNSTVSRWINGRLPEAQYCDRIADVLHLDVDDVLARAGYRPGAQRSPAEETRAALVAMMQTVNLDNPERVAHLRRTLETYLSFDRGEDPVFD